MTSDPIPERPAFWNLHCLGLDADIILASLPEILAAAVEAGVMEQGFVEQGFVNNNLYRLVEP